MNESCDFTTKLRGQAPGPHKIWLAACSNHEHGLTGERARAVCRPTRVLPQERDRLQALVQYAPERHGRA